MILTSVNNPEQSAGDELRHSVIMLVDDEPVMLAIVQALLEEAGYTQFVAVEHSPEAILTMETKQPDIVLLDLDMPMVDGFEVLQRVRQHKQFQHLPVIILTAAEDPESKLRALELGATDFLSKPVDPSELALRVRNTLTAKAYQDQLAYYDGLTRLPNRKLFLDRLNWFLQVARREKQTLALLDIGLDRFRHINETMGMSVGDQILQSVAYRIKNVIRSSDIIGQGKDQKSLENMARVGGSDFSVVLCDVSDAAEIPRICERLLEEIHEPFYFNEQMLYLTAGIGISMFPVDGQDEESLIKNAASAKEFSRQQGAGNFMFYSSEMNAQTMAIIKMESELKKALDNDGFELCYQPKVDTRTRGTIGMESLIRWNHPQDGFVPPDRFIPIAEKMGLIVALGEWVLHEACRNTTALHARGFTDLKVSVNVEAKQFSDPGFFAAVESALETSGLNPSSLVLEITESTLMGDIESIVELMVRINGLGVAFSLDDFGTGYSSLSYLKRFPISELKIDRSFLLEVPASAQDCSIVRAIIAMAHSLGLLVVAEGVEQPAQLEFLREHGCNVIQGFYFSKPLSADELVDFVSHPSA
jgi:diguanylate cyclase (GGDEF)-like protein